MVPRADRRRRDASGPAGCSSGSAVGASLDAAQGGVSRFMALSEGQDLRSGAGVLVGTKGLRQQRTSAPLELEGPVALVGSCTCTQRPRVPAMAGCRQIVHEMRLPRVGVELSHSLAKFCRHRLRCRQNFASGVGSFDADTRATASHEQSAGRPHRGNRGPFSACAGADKCPQGLQVRMTPTSVVGAVPSSRIRRLHSLSPALRERHEPRNSALSGRRARFQRKSRPRLTASCIPPALTHLATPISVWTPRRSTAPH